MRESARTTDHEAAPHGRLAELLACERELAGLLADARDEARRRVDDARAEVERAEAELEASLEEDAERVRREVREASRTRAREILERAAERAERFERLTEGDVDRLAGVAFRRLLGIEEGA